MSVGALGAAGGGGGGQAPEGPAGPPCPGRLVFKCKVERVAGGGGVEARLCPHVRLPAGEITSAAFPAAATGNALTGQERRSATTEGPTCDRTGCEPEGMHEETLQIWVLSVS